MTDAPRNRPEFTWRFLLPDFWLEWLLLLLLTSLHLLPRSWLYFVCQKLGAWHYRWDKKRRRYALINLQLCMPELSDSERELLAQQHFQARALSLVDIPMFLLASRKKILSRISLQGEQYLQQATNANKSVLILTCHSCALNYGAVTLDLKKPVIAVYNPFKTAFADWLLYRLRTRFGMLLSRRHDNFRALVKSVRKGRLLYYAPDEDLGTSMSVFVPFFARKKASLTTLGRLSELCDAQVVPSYTWYEPQQQRYVTQLLPPLPAFPGDHAEQDAKQMNAAIEQLIKLDPASYMWTLRLFKTSLPGETSVYK